MAKPFDGDHKELTERKVAMRRMGYDARNAQANKDDVSRAAIRRFVSLAEYRAAQTVMWYVDCRSELRTQWALSDALQSDKKIVVPYCTTDENGNNQLGLWSLQNTDELVVGKWKILEPPRERWDEADRQLAPETLDLVMVPGVAFSRDGGRIGNGQGYYDRLLGKVRSDCVLVGLCYESQVFDDLAVGRHDIVMDRVVTESAVYESKGRK